MSSLLFFDAVVIVLCYLFVMKMKLKAISEMPAPTGREGVVRLLGTLNYLSKFIPNMSHVTEPIRLLLRKDIEFQ